MLPHCGPLFEDPHRPMPGIASRTERWPLLYLQKVKLRPKEFSQDMQGVIEDLGKTTQLILDKTGICYQETLQKVFPGNVQFLDFHFDHQNLIPSCNLVERT